MKITGSSDWRAQLPFDVPVLVADVVPGDPTRCSDCGPASALRDRTELWAVRRHNPKSHAGVVRFHCAEHLPPPPAPAVPDRAASARRSPTRSAAPRTTPPRTTARRTAAPERIAAVCPTCFVEVPATGICGMCGERVA